MFCLDLPALGRTARALGRGLSARGFTPPHAACVDACARAAGWSNVNAASAALRRAPALFMGVGRSDPVEQAAVYLEAWLSTRPGRHRRGRPKSGDVSAALLSLLADSGLFWMALDPPARLGSPPERRSSCMRAITDPSGGAPALRAVDCREATPPRRLFGAGMRLHAVLAGRRGCGLSPEELQALWVQALEEGTTPASSRGLGPLPFPVLARSGSPGGRATARDAMAEVLSTWWPNHGFENRAAPPQPRPLPERAGDPFVLDLGVPTSWGLLDLLAMEPHGEENQARLLLRKLAHRLCRSGAFLVEDASGGPRDPAFDRPAGFALMTAIEVANLETARGVMLTPADMDPGETALIRSP